MAQAEMLAAIAALGLTMRAEFVPWSKSRNFKPAKSKITGTIPVSERSLNWRVTVCQGEREILTTDYSAGIAHCPSYKPKPAFSYKPTGPVLEEIEHETEHGTRARRHGSGMILPNKREPILPDFGDVLHSLAFDASALDCASFEEWAGDLGYDTDSRTAEATYRACLTIALALRAGIGEAGLASLKQAGGDY